MMSDCADPALRGICIYLRPDVAPLASDCLGCFGSLNLYTDGATLVKTFILYCGSSARTALPGTFSTGLRGSACAALVKNFVSNLGPLHFDLWSTAGATLARTFKSSLRGSACAALPRAIKGKIGGFNFNIWRTAGASSSTDFVRRHLSRQTLLLTVPAKIRFGSDSSVHCCHPLALQQTLSLMLELCTQQQKPFTLLHFQPIALNDLLLLTVSNVCSNLLPAPFRPLGFFSGSFRAKPLLPLPCIFKFPLTLHFQALSGAPLGFFPALFRLLVPPLLLPDLSVTLRTNPLLALSLRPLRGFSCCPGLLLAQPPLLFLLELLTSCSLGSSPSSRLGRGFRSF
eukprot:RCo029320